MTKLTKATNMLLSGIHDTLIGRTNNGDFKVSYTSSNTLTISELPDDVTAIVNPDIVGVIRYDSNGNEVGTYKFDKMHMSISGNVLTVNAAGFNDFDASSTYALVTRISLAAAGMSGGGGGSSSGASVASAEYTSPADFDAAFSTATTISLFGLPISISSSSQISFIKVIPVTGDAYILTNGSGGVTMKVVSNIITVAGAASSFISGDVYEVGINAQEKAYDASTNTQMNSVMNPEYAKYTDAETLVTAQDLTTIYADFGSAIDMRGYTKLGMKVTYDVNDGDNCKLQVLGMISMSDITPAEIDGVSEKTVFVSGDSDGQIIYEFTTNSVPVVQIQATATTTGTAGDLTIEIFKIY